MNSALYRGFVTHRRNASPAHAFRYDLCMLLLDLDELCELDGRLHLFGHNRARPVTFRDRDHLGDPRRPVKENLAALFGQRGVPFPGGRVLLLTHGRVFGYVFNPVSFFYCHDAAGTLKAVVAEVNNTFGERHPYLLPVSDGTVWRQKKLLHVSPFFSMAGSYTFELPAPAERCEAVIDLSHGDTTVLASRLSLARQPLTDGTLLAALARYPLVTVKVIAAIHWQALRLWLKGAKVERKPPYDPEAARNEPA